MINSIVFIKRQSPDWHALSQDYRRGIAIAPGRFVPDHAVPGFPHGIEALIRLWNRRFAIDFFTVRHIIAGLSDEGIRAVRNARAFDLTGLPDIQRLAGSERFIAFFHDDDDFFAGDIYDRVKDTDVFDHDTCVFPLYRIHADLFTFVRPGMQPAFALGEHRHFDFRFQSNNYGVSSRICGTGNLRALQDHVLGSAFADSQGFSEKIFPFAISATVKTPASASQLPIVMADEFALQRQFDGFIGQFGPLELPPGHDWLGRPLRVIARLLKSVRDGDGYDAISDLCAACA